MQKHDNTNFSASLVLFLAAACGLIVANIYYAQPLLHEIGRDLHIDPAATGTLVTLAQAGYGLGLLFIVPLGDIIENRKLIIMITLLGVVSLLWAGTTGTSSHFAAACFLIGIGSVAVQVIVPYAAHIAPQEIQGRVVGTVVSGLMVGIMFARPVSSFLTELFNWHVIFIMSAAVLVVLVLFIYKKLPKRVPTAGIKYIGLMKSMHPIFMSTPVLRRRALYQACMFGSFSLFWTTAPMLLAGSVYGMSQGKIALFGLAGASGAIAAPIAGRLADRGITKRASAMAISAGIIAFAMTLLAPTGSVTAVVLLVFAAVVLDFGVTANLVFGQRAIYSLGAELRGRLNGLYMATFFAGGAFGSAVGGYAFARGGWTASALTGLVFPVLAMLYLMTEPKGLYDRK